MTNIKVLQETYLVNWAKTTKRIFETHGYMYESTRISSDKGFTLTPDPSISVSQKDVKQWNAFFQSLIIEGIIKIARIRCNIIQYRFTSMEWVNRILSEAKE